MKRFIAYDNDLTPYTIVRLEPGEKPECSALSLQTEDGRPVARINRGEYDIICESDTVRVWSDDPVGP
jgi:hypothetical protein